MSNFSFSSIVLLILSGNSESFPVASFAVSGNLPECAVDKITFVPSIESLSKTPIPTAV
jgi:hypothetical protein